VSGFEVLNSDVGTCIVYIWTLWSSLAKLAVIFLFTVPDYSIMLREMMKMIISTRNLTGIGGQVLLHAW